MANILSQEKANAIASAYMTNGYKKVEALLSVGYKTTYANSNVGLKLFDNVRVKEAVARINAASNLKTDYTVDFVRQKMIKLLEMSEDANDRTNIKGALELLGKHKAMFSDKVINIDESKTYIDENKRAEAERIAKIRLLQG